MASGERDHKSYEPQFLKERNFPEYEGKTRTYAICSTPRSGSHMVGHVLWSTSMMGYPLEYCHPDNLSTWKTIYNADTIESAFESLRRNRTSPNGIFGCKLHYAHYEALLKSEKFDSVVQPEKFIYVRRRDLLGQAISLARASMTGSWISGQDPVRSPRYDEEKISECLKSLALDNASWEYAFAQMGVQYLEVVYEDFVEQQEALVEKIANYVEVPQFSGYEKGGSEASTKPQRDDLSKEWRERYLNDAGQSSNRVFVPSIKTVVRRWANRLFS